MGVFFVVGKFPGGNFPGNTFPGGIFPGGIFPGDIFPRTPCTELNQFCLKMKNRKSLKIAAG